MNEAKIRSVIRTILKEEREENQENQQQETQEVKAGEINLSVGRGRFTKVVADAGALAKDDPKQLMKNLKVSGGGTDLDGVVKVVKQAIEGTEPMKKAYGGISKVTKGQKTGIKISMGELDVRNGAKFLHHTLMGADAAGLFNAAKPLQIEVNGNDIIIYNAKKRRSWDAEAGS